MKTKFPKPSPNWIEYEKIMERGFKRFPERKQNYDKFLELCTSNNYDEKSECMPIKMDYEVSNKCNFKCRMCLLRQKSNIHIPQMDLKAFEKSLDQQYGLIEVKLQGLGEPLLNPDFFKMVHQVVERDIWCRTTINGSLLHINSNYKKMIDEKIGEIQISIDGATKQTFERIRVGSIFEQVVENVKLLNEYAREKGEIWRTSCWMLVQKDNYHEMEQLLDLAEYMKFTRVVYSLDISNWGKDELELFADKLNASSLVTDELLEHLIKKGRERGIEVAIWSDEDKYIYSASHENICTWLWSRAFISADMKIVPCCVLSDSDTYNLGDALSFKENWNDEGYRRLRNMHLQGNLPAMCRNCYQN